MPSTDPSVLAVKVYRIGDTFHLCLPAGTITTEDLNTSALVEQCIPNDGTTKWVEFDCTDPGTELN